VIANTLKLDAREGSRMSVMDAAGLAELVDSGQVPRPGTRPRNPYKGITQHHGRWCAQIYFRTGDSRRGRARYLGTFGTPEEAARAYDAAVDQFTPGEAKNFPGPGEKRAPCFNPRHGYYGVYPKRGKWLAAVWIPSESRSVYLGAHDTPQEAARIRDAEIIARGIKAPLNFPGEGGTP
jgi:hypothetical protein